MTQIILEVDNEQDTRLFLDLAKRLHVRFKTTISQVVVKSDLTSEELQGIIQHGKGLSFLENDAESIYNDTHLKVKF